MTNALQKANPKSVSEYLQKEGVIAKIQNYLPAAGVTAARFSQLCIMEINRNPGLQKCSFESVVRCMMQSAELGLTPGGKLGEAYLVPYGDQCTFIVGYKGLINLARRSGQIASINSQLVCDNDVFEYEQGLNPKLVHKPALGNRGNVIGAYAIAFFRDGQTLPQVEWMDIDQVDAIKNRSKASRNGPWVTDTGQMQRKTVIRRLMNYLPLSPDDQLRAALTADEDDIVEATATRVERVHVASADDLDAMLGTPPAEPEPDHDAPAWSQGPE